MSRIKSISTWSAASASLALLATAQGCPPIGANPRIASSATAGASPASSPTPTIMSGGPRAIRIVFKQSYPQGSFDASPSNGTPARPGSGQQAARFFNADGSILAGGISGSWLSSFEIGVSGANNGSAKNGACAKFADATESSSADNCNFMGPTGTAAPIGCGAPNGLFRISEYDCVGHQGEVAADGTGGPGDGVYLRATFNRDLLGTGENLLASLEYVASAFDAAPSNPRDCFENGVPKPEKCSNVTWKTYVKHSTDEIVQPFFMLVPPTQNFVNTGIGTSGVSPQMRQFVIPLSGDPKLNTLQISRTRSSLDPLRSQTACNYNSSPTANSPLCAGIVFYSLTLYRI